MNEFSPILDEATLLALCLEGVTNFTNIMLKKFPFETRTKLRQLISNGARVVVAIELNPLPTISCAVHTDDTVIDLFQVQLPGPQAEAEETRH